MNQAHCSTSHAALGTTLVLLLFAPAVALETCDDFTSDPDPFDCSPVCWETTQCCQAGFRPEDGGLAVEPVMPRVLGLLFASGELAGDVRVHLTARIVGADTRSVVAALHFDPSRFSGYFGGLRRDSAGTWNVIISRYEAGQFLGRQGAPIDFDPFADAVNVEFASVGDLLEVRAWPASRARPEQAGFDLRNNRFRVGRVGFGYNTWRTRSYAIFSRVCFTENNPNSFLRGDCTDDGEVNLADATCTLNWLFAGGAEPGCVAALNTNGDDAVNITDPVSLLNFLFAGGPAPIGPFPDCGPGMLPADEQLGCANPPNCQ